MDSNENNKDKYNENNEDKIEKLKRKKLIITITISVIIYILIIVIYQIVSYYTSPGRLYEKQTLEYLQEKYNEDFKVKFVRKRNASTYKESSCDSSTFYMLNGTDKNIKEYIYSFSPENNPKIVCYVVYAHNIEENSYEIYETSSATGRLLCGEENKEINRYENATEYYNQKMDIKDSLESYLGKEYTINLYYDNRTINVKSSKSLEKYVLNNYYEFANLYNNIRELLSDKDIRVRLEYKDEHVTITKDSKIESDYTIKEYLE